MKRKVYPMMLLIVSLLICIGLSISALAANTEIEISSPDESVRFVFSIGTSGSISYTIYKGEANIITDSALGINTDAEDFRSGLSFVSCTQNLVNEDYDLLYGKTASVHDSYRNAGIVLQKNNKTLVLNVKVFNDGVAFNYEIPGSGSVEILTESTEINLPDNTGGWGYNWRSDYEGMYEYRSSASLRNSDVAMPFLASINNNAYWALLTEGDVYNDGSYCASHLKGTLTNKLRVVYAPEQTDNILTEYPVKTPYRVIIITDNLNDLVNSTLVTSLNPQPEEQDTSWIYSGKSAWSWWSEERSPQWFLRQKEYVDFAARNGWEYVTVDAGWDDTWIPALCDYAAPKNVGIIIWTDVGAIDTQSKIDEKLSQWASWGIRGIKVDFMMNDSQTRMNTYQMIASKATSLELLVNFHGSTKPSGESRTYPNIITSEAIRGAEHYKWSEYPTAYHNCTVPFTRNVIGGMDYTPVVISTNNLNTTQAHQLALSVVFESPMQHFADSIDSYDSWVGLTYLNSIPCKWDETVLLDGFPGNYVTMARRSGADWFIGAITDQARTITIDTNFLPQGKTYTAYIYSDGTRKEYICTSTEVVTTNSTLQIQLAATGGCAIRITEEDHSMGIISDDSYTYYEAEMQANLLSGQASIVACENCSGGYKVGNLGGSAQSSITFKNIVVDESGTYSMKILYLSEETRGCFVSANNQSAQYVSFTPTGSYFTVKCANIELNLIQGNNTITFTNSGYVPDIDRIGIRKSNTVVFESYEAENARITSPARTYSSSSFSGSGKVGYIGYDGFLEFAQVTAPKDGVYLLRIYYATSDNRELYIGINEQSNFGVICFESGSFDSVEYKEVLVNLRAGDNTVRLSNPEGYAPDIDYIAVSTLPVVE